jgi:hypothetical protein
MTIGNVLTKHLRELAADASQPLQVSIGPLRAELAFFDRDRYSVTMRELTIGADAGAPEEARAFLSAAAAAAARRLSFLEEPLAVWELDGAEGMAQLRSSPPQRDADEIAYWEVTLWAGQPRAHVARYRWAPGMLEREAVAYPATFALLGRMADALAESLGEAAS